MSILTPALSDALHELKTNATSLNSQMTEEHFERALNVVRASALRDAATSFIDWGVMYGIESSTPDIERSHKDADWLMREADRIEGKS